MSLSLKQKFLPTSVKLQQAIPLACKQPAEQSARISDHPQFFTRALALSTLLAWCNPPSQLRDHSVSLSQGTLNWLEHHTSRSLSWSQSTWWVWEKQYKLHFTESKKLFRKDNLGKITWVNSRLLQSCINITFLVKPAVLWGRNGEKKKALPFTNGKK